MLLAFVLVGQIDGGEGDRSMEAGGGLKRYVRTEPHMGTYFTIILYAPDSEAAEAAFHAGFQRIRRLDEIFSDYRPDSELNRLCRQAGAGPVHVSRELFEVLTLARRVSEASRGAFDVTVKPVVRLWRRARRQRRPPSQARLRAALELVDYRAIELDAARRTVRLRRRGMRLDLGGIAKGYTLAAVLSELAARGIQRALVDGGGDIAVADPPPNKNAWRVLVPTPEEMRGEPVILRLRHSAVATSGDAEQYVVLNAKRYSHIIDPRTGWPVVGPRQVTVVHSCATLADAWATALSVLEPEEAIALADARGLAARVIYSPRPGSFESLDSRAFRKLVSYQVPSPVPPRP